MHATKAVGVNQATAGRADDPAAISILSESLGFLP